ncbi:IS5/IS1182 family transposase, partial [Rhizobium sp. SEMIA 4088]
LKQFRRVATRYDKLLVNFRGFVIIAAIAIWLK